MRPALWASLAAVLLVAAGCGAGTEVDPPRPAPTSLTIAFEPRGPEGPTLRATLGCNPHVGTHPNRFAACAALLGNLSALDPVPGDVACTEIFGGPERARIRGIVTSRGQGVVEREIDARLSRSNGCEIERWDRLEPLLDLQ